jgi:hypothetical protein
VPDMLGMAALELGDPVSDLVAVVAGDFSLRDRSLFRWMLRRANFFILKGVQEAEAKWRKHV